MAALQCRCASYNLNGKRISRVGFTSTAVSASFHSGTATSNLAFEKTLHSKFRHQESSVLCGAIDSKLGNELAQLIAFVSDGEKTLEEERLDLTGKEFNWFKTWWPVQAVENLKTDRPNKIQLLGKDFIVWKGHSGKWIAMNDECPHRMAPLSEGRIEDDGNLLCSYHAWRFNESGKCVKIPHAEDEKAHSIACNSPRSSVQTYPCQARGALFWIWPDSSPNAESDSAATSLPIEEVILDNLEMETEHGIEQLYFRFLPYSYDVLMENLCDPSHLHVSHHKVNPGLSRDNAKPLNARYFDGFGDIPPIAAMKYTFAGLDNQFGEIDFRHPAVIATAFKDKASEKISAVSFFIGAPVSSGRSLFITMRAGTRLLQHREKPSLLDKILLKPISWTVHALLLNKILDSDSVLLQLQDKNLRKARRVSTASTQYFIPTSADLLSIAFRKWFEEIGKSGAAYGADQAYVSSMELTKGQLLDRYEQHTKHCRQCSQVLDSIRKTILLFKTASVFAVFSGTCLLLRKSVQSSFCLSSILKSRGIMTATLCFLLCSVMTFVLERVLIPQFYFVDFSHADND